MSRDQETARLTILCMLAVFGFCTVLCAKREGPVYYDVKDVGEPTAEVPFIEPWKVVSLDVEYGGQWVVAGDVDNDGLVEIVSAENVNENDVHYTSTAAAQKLDG